MEGDQKEPGRAEGVTSDPPVRSSPPRWRMKPELGAIEAPGLTVKHMPIFRKKDYPVAEIRRYLEPGPVVSASSAWQGNTYIMTMGWHMVLQFSPSLVGVGVTVVRDGRVLLGKRLGSHGAGEVLDTRRPSRPSRVF